MWALSGWPDRQQTDRDRLTDIDRYLGLETHRHPSLFCVFNIRSSSRSNLTGTEFLFFDEGVAADIDARLFPAQTRRQHGLIVYERNILGTQPRAFEVAVPLAYDGGTIWWRWE